MSDSESDEEFLSADEGDLEDSKSMQIKDEEVDEIMDILMKKESLDQKCEISDNITLSKTNLVQSIDEAVQSSTLCGAADEKHFVDSKDIKTKKSDEPYKVQENVIDSEKLMTERFSEPEISENESNNDNEGQLIGDDVKSNDTKLNKKEENVQMSETNQHTEKFPEDSIEPKDSDIFDNLIGYPPNEIHSDKTEPKEIEMKIATKESKDAENNKETKEKEMNVENEVNVVEDKSDIVCDIVVDINVSAKEKQIKFENDKEVGENLDDLDLDDDVDHDDTTLKYSQKEAEYDMTKMEELSNQTALTSDKLFSESNDSDVQEDRNLGVENTDKEDRIEVKNIDQNDGWDDWGDDATTTNEPFAKDAEKLKKEDSKETKKLDTEPPKKKSEANQLKTSSDNDWGWDSWADDFIIQAAGKVSNFLENVEGQLGIPDPTKMAEVVTKEEKNESTVNRESNSLSKEIERNQLQPQASPKTNEVESNQSAGVSSWFGGFSSIVQSTSSELVTGGIGALEFIGKKTVDILSEGDPGLRQKRDALKSKQGNNLSAVLREAKKKNEETENSQHVQCVRKQEDMKFNDLFEKYQGNAHLDALEMLSNECESKLERILGFQSDMSKEETMKILSETRNNYELPDLDDPQDEYNDLKKELFGATKKLKLKVTCSKLLNTWQKIKEKSNECTSPRECFESTLSSLAEMTSRCVEYHRKVADMLMVVDVQAKELAVQRASTLRSISQMFQTEISHLTNEFAQNLREDKESKTLMADIYLEGSNCCSMIRDCHYLLLPILQCCVIK